MFSQIASLILNLKLIYCSRYQRNSDHSLSSKCRWAVFNWSYFWVVNPGSCGHELKTWSLGAKWSKEINNLYSYFWKSWVLKSAWDQKTALCLSKVPQKWIKNYVLLCCCWNAWLFEVSIICTYIIKLGF